MTDDTIERPRGLAAVLNAAVRSYGFSPPGKPTSSGRTSTRSSRPPVKAGGFSPGRPNSGASRKKQIGSEARRRNKDV